MYIFREFGDLIRFKELTNGTILVSLRDISEVRLLCFKKVEIISMFIICWIFITIKEKIILVLVFVACKNRCHELGLSFLSN